MIDTDLTDDEALLAKTTRAYFADFVDNTYLNAQQESPDGYETRRWQQMCELGWTGIDLPERVGGAGGTLAEAGVVAREAGRAAFASPLLSTMRAGTVLATLGRAVFDDALTRIAAGSPAALVAPADSPVQAEATGDGAYRLAGPAVTVEWLEPSDDVVLLLPVAGGDGWLCALLRGADLRARAEAVPSIDNERIARVDLEGLTLAPADVALDVVDARTARYALARANLLRASAMVGGCEAVLERSVQYATERVQFGQPIGAFQAVRHHLGRMMIARDAARLACNDALTRARPGADESAIAAVALFAAGRSYVEIVLTAAQIHGGVGTTTEHVLHHHFLRAKAMQLRGGKRANRLREIHQALVVRREGSLW
ncbi:acyl-CoA dehydrogenase family protein [Dactylosporangium sp. AC04546]|uniref:acyl-CoA dehydrogenase family protein n=1 Tax=Dactylosporangium sp. AC04546 TaxID=2862460 RepID=UPI001EE11CB9|nr:acyl-CoA dehydrogenase family protein [Dactylosporangium sp. AC04546]WVK87269.1 acyl-CoA dehydrogenase family protein [Dactylosporangium sp. AC04546]